MSASPSAPGALNWFLIIALGVIWGTAFMGVSTALTGLTPWWITAGRVGLAALILLPVGALMGQGLGKVRGGRAWAVIAFMGLISTALPFALLSWGLTQVPSAFAGVAMGTVPLLVLPLVAVFSPDEGIGPRRIVGVVLGFAGLVLLMGPGAFGEGKLAGRLACVGAAACYAVGSVVTRRAPPIPPVAFAAGSMLIGAIALVPLAYAFEGVPELTRAAALWALFYVALLPTGIAAIIRVRVITTAGSLFMSLTSYMVPLWAVIFGVTIMGEALPAQLFWALGIILAGIGISQSRAIAQQLRPKTKT
ncbi:DMT family transporter [Gymnodinialimonas hymeniacidonis]|uniref:DMT family transporter n=1 Tax=Gymnodinialimonas hymeniacidonis TaxID=3126508 RepID=UPI0034C5CE2C